MEYLITTIDDNKRTVVSRHNSKEEAFKAGDALWEKVAKGVHVSCISGQVDENGKTIGKYRLYKAWY